MTSFIKLLYGILIALFEPCYRFLILPRRLKKGKEDPRRYLEKLGSISNAKGKAQKCVWFHAASVGESLSLLKLIEAFIKEYPTWDILLTTGTMTSAKIVEQRFPKKVIHQYAPLDFKSAIKRFLSHWKPDLMVWVESELWPNLIFQAHKQKIPLVLLNMRLSTRSFKRWVFLRSVFLDLLNCFDLVLTQTKELDQNLKHIGYKNSAFCGNLKYAADHPGYSKQELSDLQKSLKGCPHWMAASTHKGEEEIVLDAHTELKKTKENACLVLVIRHPHRCEEVERLIQNQGLSVQRYSAWQKDKNAPFEADVLLVDQIGVMGLFYEHASFVLVGGSLVDKIGGHNILEPMRQNCVALHGPYMGNFKEIIKEAQVAKAALLVKDKKELAFSLLELIDNPKIAQTYTKNASLFLTQQTKVLSTILERLSPYLKDVNGKAQNNQAKPIEGTESRENAVERA